LKQTFVGSKHFGSEVNFINLANKLNCPLNETNNTFGLNHFAVGSKN
jgi:hypothetical protein